jgi:type I restriction enzyme S subunit
MSFPRYPKYKPSGVEWLEEVPERWEMKRLDFLAGVKARLGWKGLTANEYVPEGFIFLATPNIKGQGEIDFVNVNFITAERYCESPEIMIQVGDVLMAKDGSTLGTTNVVRHLPAPATVNSSVAVLRPKPALNSCYFFRWLTSVYLQSLIQSMKDGQGVPHLFQADIRKFPILLPPLPEQTAIAEFLDRETGKIDELVGEQRRLMELLKEKRQAVISHAVTKGLNPHAPMKPSGIEWLGDVPVGWTVKRFQRCVYVAEGQVDPTNGNFANMSLIAPNHIESGTGRLLALETSAEQGAESGKYLCKTGDVVYSKIRPALRKVCIAPEECLCSADMYPLRPHSGLTARFLFWLILSEQFSALAELESQRVAMPKINRESLKAVMLAVPPIEEQNTTNAFLEAETAKFDTLTAEAQRAIDLLQERRTALISAAVTGQIDVRQAHRN